MALHVLAFLVVSAPRVVVVPVEGGHDASIEAVITEGARAAGLDVVPLGATKSIERSVSCKRSEVDCLLRMAALGDVDGAIAWSMKAEQDVEIVVASIEHKRDARGTVAKGARSALVDESARLCREAFAPGPTSTPTPTSTTTPPTAPHPAPTPTATPEPPVTPPPSPDPPSPPSAATSPAPPPLRAPAATRQLDVMAISLTAGGGIVALACAAGALVLDAGLAADIDRAERRITPRPADFETRQALFVGSLAGAGAGVIAAGIGGAMLVME